MADDPQVRASAAKGMLQGMLRVAEHTGRRGWDPEASAAVRDASRLQWLPLSTHLAMLEDGRRTLGDEGYRRATCQGTLASFELPPLHGLIRTAIRLFTGNPERIMSWAPKGWEASFRGCGSLRYELHGGERVTVTVEGFPARDARHYDTFGIGFAGTLDAILELVSARGTVTLTEADPTTRRLAYEMRWDEVEADG